MQEIRLAHGASPREQGVRRGAGTLKLGLVALALALWSALSIGCAHGPTIPPGTYVADDGVERVTVTDSKARFTFRSGESPAKPPVTREYDLATAPDGRIQPHPLTSWDAAFGVGLYDWWWDGTGIVRENPRTGESMRFVAEDRADP